MRPPHLARRIGGIGSLSGETWWMRIVEWERDEYGEPTSTPGEARRITVRTLPGQANTTLVESSPGLRVQGRRRFWIADQAARDIQEALAVGNGVQLYGGQPPGWWRVYGWADHVEWIRVDASWLDAQPDAPD